jgi:hypothetical protein
MKTRELAVVSYMDTRLDISIYFNGRIRKLVLLLTDEFLPSSYYLDPLHFCSNQRNKMSASSFFSFFGGASRVCNTFIRTCNSLSKSSGASPTSIG